MSTVTFEGVTKRYGEVLAVDSLDLEIRDGEFMVFVGPSGCGKTSFLNVLGQRLGLSRGSKCTGEVRVNDRVL